MDRDSDRLFMAVDKLDLMAEVDAGSDRVAVVEAAAADQQ